MHRCLQQFPKEQLFPVFADTMSESPDLYKLLDEIENKFELKIERLNQGKNIWDVFSEHRLFKDSWTGACKASVELKRLPLRQHLENLGSSSQVVVCPGLNFDEPDRQERLQNNLAPYAVYFPLNEKPRLSSCDIIRECQKLGFNIPEAYVDGFAHNNCNSCCILAGVTHWAKLYEIHPERFQEAADKERPLYAQLGFSILKDRRGGITKSYPLSQLKEDIDNGREISTERLSACNCLVPGYQEPIDRGPPMGYAILKWDKTSLKWNVVFYSHDIDNFEQMKAKFPESEGHEYYVNLRFTRVVEMYEFVKKARAK